MLSNSICIAKSYLSGSKTSQIVHFTKINSITESKVAIKICLTTSLQNIVRLGFKVNAHLPICL